MGSNYLPTEYQSFIHMSRYSRWLEEEGRRETWTETVGRLIVYFKNQIDVNYKGIIKDKEWKEIFDFLPLKINDLKMKKSAIMSLILATLTMAKDGKLEII